MEELTLNDKATIQKIAILARDAQTQAFWLAITLKNNPEKANDEKWVHSQTRTKLEDLIIANRHIWPNSVPLGVILAKVIGAFFSAGEASANPEEYEVALKKAYDAEHEMRAAFYIDQLE